MARRSADHPRLHHVPRIELQADGEQQHRHAQLREHVDERDLIDVGGVDGEARAKKSDERRQTQDRRAQATEDGEEQRREVDPLHGQKRYRQ